MTVGRRRGAHGSIVRYGENVRPWPLGGYFFSYEALLSTCVETVGNAEKRGSIHVFVEQSEDGAWKWRVGWFTWTPDGDLYESLGGGLNATRKRALDDARQCAHNRRVKLTQMAAERIAQV